MHSAHCRRLLLLLSLVVLICARSTSGVTAAPAPTQEKGLLITPLRQFISVDAGATNQSSFSIANLNDQPLEVNLQVKQFSVTDYAYSYTFGAPDNNWVRLAEHSVTLQPHQTKDIRYSLSVPAGSAPGGHYYTLFASANLGSAGIEDTIQAADLVYLTVNGKLTSVSHLQASSIHWLSFGHDISFNLQPINTGNEYSYVYVSGELHGPLVKPPQTSNAHLLMPGKVRNLSGTIPAPLFPGIYRATYGYKTTSDWIIQETHWVIYVPPWFIAFLIATLLLAGRLLPRPKSPVSDQQPTDT